MGKFIDGSILDKLDDIEEPSIVKIYTKIIGRKYKRRYHAYPKYLVPVSACYNDLTADFLEQLLEERIYVLGGTMLLMLTQRKGEEPQNGNK